LTNSAIATGFTDKSGVLVCNAFGLAGTGIKFKRTKMQNARSS